MSGKPWTCPSCDYLNSAGADRCPRCATPRPGAPPGAPREPTFFSREDGDVEQETSAAPEELLRRIERLGHWSEASPALGLELPRLPPWVLEAVTRAPPWEVWNGAIQRLEQEARHRADRRFHEMIDRLAPRLARLEAYSIETRAEREELEEATRAARSGDLALALSLFPQVDRVVGVKEHHLDQARDDLERLLTLLRDLEAIGFEGVDRAQDVSAELERELRAGRLVALRQRLRASRTRASSVARGALADYVARLGERLRLERTRGLATDRDVRDLAEGARAIVDGQVEEGARLLRRIGAPRGVRAGPAPDSSTKA